MEGRKRRGGAADEGFGANSNVLCCRKFTRKGICAPIFASLSNAKGWSAPSNLSVQVCQCFDRCPAGLSLALKTCTLVKLLRAHERGACALRDDVSLRSVLRRAFVVRLLSYYYWCLACRANVQLVIHGVSSLGVPLRLSRLQAIRCVFATPCTFPTCYFISSTPSSSSS